MVQLQVMQAKIQLWSNPTHIVIVNFTEIVANRPF